jgi:predicted negative regulator of RcsB-dependent stress response
MQKNSGYPGDNKRHIQHKKLRTRTPYGDPLENDMKAVFWRLSIFGLLTLTVLSGNAAMGQTSADSATPFPVLRGPYLGQNPPGLKPVRFAPGVVSTDRLRERDVAMPADLSEIYFTRQGKIQWTRLVDGRWTEPETTPFATEYLSFEPFLTADRNRLYYISQRPLAGAGEIEPWQIWYVDRTATGWSAPRRLTTGGQFYPSITSDGFMYVTSVDNDIYRGTVANNQLQNLERLNDSVNTTSDEYNAFVAPDGSYLLLTSFGYGPDYGGGDLYVSFRKPDGSWGHPRNTGFGINSATQELSPYVSPDGKYLFFCSRKDGSEDIYWVDAGILEILRTTDLDLAGMLQKTMEQSGVDAMRRQYTDMKSAYARYGDFTQDILGSVSDRLLVGGKNAEAANVLRLNFELYPEANTEMARLRLALIDDDTAAFSQAAAPWRARSAELTVAEETALNLAGYDFLRRGDIARALKLFRLYTELFPKSFNAYDSYGEALLAGGDTTNAVANYRKSLELNPKNVNATAILKRLGVDSSGSAR